MLQVADTMFFNAEGIIGNKTKQTDGYGRINIVCRWGHARHQAHQIIKPNIEKNGGKHGNKLSSLFTNNHISEIPAMASKKTSKKPFIEKSAGWGDSCLIGSQGGSGH